MKITREWAMPNKSTFNIPCINNLIKKIISNMPQPPLIADPFVGQSPFNKTAQGTFAPFTILTNDLDPNITAECHEDALDFLKILRTATYDIVLFDPPFSPRQVSECYKKLGRTVNMKTTQASYWSKLKEEIIRITHPDSIVVTCAWNSGGIGKKLGFEIEEILLVAHGSWHNDTIITVEKKIR